MTCFVIIISEIWLNILFDGTNFLFWPFLAIFHVCMLNVEPKGPKYPVWYDPISCSVELTSCLAIFGHILCMYAQCRAQRTQIFVNSLYDAVSNLIQCTDSRYFLFGRINFLFGLFDHKWCMCAEYIAQRFQIFIHFDLGCSISKIWPNFLFSRIDVLFGLFGRIRSIICSLNSPEGQNCYPFCSTLSHFGDKIQLPVRQNRLPVWHILSHLAY